MPIDPLPASPGITGRILWFSRNAEDLVRDTYWKPDVVPYASAQTIPRYIPVTNVVTAPADGVLTLFGGAVLKPNVTVTGITFYSSNTAIGAVTHQWFVLVDAITLAVLGKTVDDGATAWAVQSPKNLLLAAPYTPTIPQAVYLGIVCAGAAGPGLRGLAAQAGAPPHSSTPALAGISNSALVVPADLPGTINALGTLATQAYAHVT